MNLRLSASGFPEEAKIIAQYEVRDFSLIEVWYLPSLRTANNPVRLLIFTCPISESAYPISERRRAQQRLESLCQLRFPAI